MEIKLGGSRVNQCQKPTGLLGRFVLRMMNSRHSKVTDWGLSHVAVDKQYKILDAGCGGGRTVSKLASMATQGKVYGIDFSRESVAVASKANKQSIQQGRVEIRECSVSQLPFPDNMFDLITAVETHFWWPDLPADMREVFRVLKPGGRLVIVAEIYGGAQTKVAAMAEKYLPFSGMKLLTLQQHRELLENAGYTDIQVIDEPANGWVCAMGRKPIPS